MLLSGIPVRERVIQAISFVCSAPIPFAGSFWTAFALSAIFFSTRSALADEKPNDCKCGSAFGEVITIVGTYEPIWHYVLLDDDPHCTIILQMIIPKSGAKVTHICTYTGPKSAEGVRDLKNWKTSSQNMVEITAEQAKAIRKKFDDLHLKRNDRIQVRGRLCWYHAVVEPSDVQDPFNQGEYDHYFISMADAKIVKLKGAARAK